jgi:hypothetical protein
VGLLACVHGKARVRRFPAAWVSTFALNAASGWHAVYS